MKNANLEFVAHFGLAKHACKLIIEECVQFWVPLCIFVRELWKLFNFFNQQNFHKIVTSWILEKI
jgi:hypothetical protein